MLLHVSRDELFAESALMTIDFRHPARVMPWSRANLSQLDAPARFAHNDDRPNLPESEKRVPFEPDRLLVLKDDITRAVFTDERATDRVEAVRDDTVYLRLLAGNLRMELEMERSQAGRRLLAQGRSMSKQQRRTAAVETCADNLAGMLLDLEQQLTSDRTQTERLVEAVDHFVTTDADPYRLHG